MIPLKMTFLPVVAAAMLAAQPALADTYVIDKAHSTVGFQIRHLFSKVTGRFTDFSGRITYDEAHPDQSAVEVLIKAASIDTANEKRDADLRSANFFHADEFPEITFKSDSVKPTGNNAADVTGKLTMHGVTKEVVLKSELLGKGAGMQGKTVAGWDATTTLKRSEFGLTWNQVVEGTQVVGDDVQVELHIEADKQP